MKINHHDEEPHLTPQLKDHYENEAEILSLLVNLEKRYRDYFEYYQCEIKAQRILIERLWLLTQRYLILISAVPCCRYPEVYTLSAEETIVNEYEEKLEVIRKSNKDMKYRVLELDKYCKQFYKAYDKLDKTMETPFIMGDQHHRSIRTHKIMVADIFNYFHAAVLKLKCFMHQLDPVNLESVEDYREVLKTEGNATEVDEYLKTQFVYCHCLHPKPKCPLVEVKCDYHKIENLKFVSRV
ncbi:uncharacterized protein Dwil_GK24215 [Drosophila willistoni]|uniref:Uncharacterized protein n=1 Tax=Drosophila willistoni TaxID=7260 RepID=B4N1F1_DROWI|nr:uncharacterized protein LOC6643968 [Drosophila willistoni]EDW78062.1 uncharacterized protein Dwil_GK24215 [Drosophila willistoni]